MEGEREGLANGKKKQERWPSPNKLPRPAHACDFFQGQQSDPPNQIFPSFYKAWKVPHLQWGSLVGSTQSTYIHGLNLAMYNSMCKNQKCIYFDSALFSEYIMWVTLVSSLQ